VLLQRQSDGELQLLAIVMYICPSATVCRTSHVGFCRSVLPKQRGLACIQLLLWGLFWMSLWG